MTKLKTTLLLTYLSFSALMLNSQTLVTSTGLTPTQYVQNVLLGSGVTVSNVTFTGYANAIGKFVVNGAPNTLNIDSGLVLTTGTVLNNDPGGPGPHGPNASGSSGFSNSGGSDPDLNQLG